MVPQLTPKHTSWTVGEVDVHWVLNALADRDYGGSISVEYLETERFDALAEAKRAADMISAMPTLMH